MANIITRDGSSQDERMLLALREGYINVDEMRFEDLLALASEHAGLLKYFDLSNQPMGDWKGFFESDEACILASILALRLHLFESEFSRFMAGWGTAIANLQHGHATVDILPAFRLAKKIDSWYVQLERLQSVAAIRAREKIAEVIENSLGYELQRLHALMRQFQAKGTETAIQEFDGIWSRPEALSGTASHAANHTTEQFLKSNFHAFYNAVTFLQGCAEELLVTSLGRQSHDPAIGLHIAFLKLFSKVQGRLNGFTQKHLNFYYEKILKIQRQGFIPDSAYLIFSPDTAGREVQINSGTKFKAGLDENNVELLYTADSDLLVNDAKVCSLHTLYFGRNRLSFPENALAAPPAEDGHARKFSTSAKLNRLADMDANNPANTGTKCAPLFGVPPQSRESHLFEEARLGFAVASNVLLMKQGTRDITLTFKLETPDQKTGLDSFISNLREALDEPSRKATVEDAFFKAFRKMFKISLTGETGWLEVEEYLPLSHVLDEYSGGLNSFQIQIRLPDSAGAVVPYAPAIHGERFDTDLPIIKFAINPDAYLYPYSFLCDLVVSEVVIEVEVTGCTDVKIYNQLSPLSNGSQFNPFGPMPATGDYLVVGNYEVAQKTLTSFEVDIEWGNLPHEMNGFEEYYRAYSMPFNNAAFKANLSVLRDRKWLPADEKGQQTVDLFSSAGIKNGNNKAEKKRRISFQGLCKFLRPIEKISKEKYGYDALTKDGFFRITLSNPENAFGHKIYPMILSNVMLENARLKKFGLLSLLTKTLPPRPLPNPPYTPLINTISINYKATSSINLGRVTSADEGRTREKMFHLHPLGLQKLSPRAYGNISLVPQYESDGNLFIGLSASKLSGLLTLFFHLREDSLPEAGAREFHFTWHYLSSNHWKKFDKSQVVSDTTNGFLSSGIVTLDMPDDINRGNTILPDNLFWIRVSVNNRHMHTLCSFYGVHAQALRVSWVRQPGNSLSHLAEKLAAGTIKEAVHTIPGIVGINQLMDSFGGRAVENDEQRTVRVSERLKHKNRAITPWDYERLILQRFPEIYKVNCLPCTTDDDDHWKIKKTGHLLIVVIPYLKEPASVNMQPMVNALLLRKVREFVKELSPSFVEISVRNPAYEQIQVRCKVKFRRGMGQGIYFSELNNEIVNFISPWSSVGMKANFDWRIRCNDIQSHIQGLSYVESVTGLSMLCVTATAGHKYLLSDTARETKRGSEINKARTDEVKSTYPWSIAVPLRNHLIDVVGEGDVCPPEQTGIKKLAIGSTFILSRRHQ